VARATSDRLSIRASRDTANVEWLRGITSS
jgi:hypothetical protein